MLLGSFGDCLTWTPSQRPLQHQIKLLQQLTWVNKDLVQFQNQFPILMRQQYSTLWVMQWAQAEKMVRSQGNQEFQKPLCWMFVCSCASITLLFFLYRIKTLTAPCHYSFKKCSQCTCILTLEVKTWWAVLHSSKAVCSMSNSGLRHRNGY